MWIKNTALGWPKCHSGFSVRYYKQPEQPFWPTQYQHWFTFGGFPGAENDGGQGISVGMGLLYLYPGGVCLRAAQNHHWQDKKKWASEEGVWSKVVGNKLRSHPVILPKFLTASASSWWWGWGEECWERWLEREPGRPTFQHFGTFKLISVTILSSSSLFL